jgi:thiosulfate reductase cytochrome b subunit
MSERIFRAKTMNHLLTSVRTTRKPATDEPPKHPVWVHVTHRLNALAAITMMLSGWRIYDAEIFVTNTYHGGDWVDQGYNWFGGA